MAIFNYKSSNSFNCFYVWYICNSMRYEYIIKDTDNTEEIVQAMSYKKLLKKLSIKYKNKIVQIKYTNKKDHELIKLVKIKEVD